MMKKPLILMPAVVASVINGAVAAAVFGIKQNGAPLSSGMGTSGLVGPISVVTGWFSPSEAALAAGELAIAPVMMDWLGLVLVAFVIPAVVSWLVAEFMYKKNILVAGDMKIDT